jgi:ribosomal subunit interface protein
MDIIIQAKDFKIGNSLQAFVTDKVGKLYNKCKSIIRAEVILRQGGYAELENKLCEIRLLVPGNDHIVKVSSTIYEKSILKAVNVLQKILRRNKTKVISRRHLIYS